MFTLDVMHTYSSKHKKNPHKQKNLITISLIKLIMVCSLTALFNNIQSDQHDKSPNKTVGGVCMYNMCMHLCVCKCVCVCTHAYC